MHVPRIDPRSYSLFLLASFFDLIDTFICTAAVSCLMTLQILEGFLESTVSQSDPSSSGKLRLSEYLVEEKKFWNLLTVFSAACDVIFVWSVSSKKRFIKGISLSARGIKFIIVSAICKKIGFLSSQCLGSWLTSHRCFMFQVSSLTCGSSPVVRSWCPEIEQTPIQDTLDELAWIWSMLVIAERSTDTCSWKWVQTKGNPSSQFLLNPLHLRLQKKRNRTENIVFKFWMRFESWREKIGMDYLTKIRGKFALFLSEFIQYFFQLFYLFFRTCCLVQLVFD